MSEDIHPLSWLPAITKTLTARQRAELMQVIDLAWATAYEEQSDGRGAYAPVNFGDIEVLHREVHAQVQRDIRRQHSKATTT